MAVLAAAEDIGGDMGSEDGLVVAAAFGGVADDDEGLVDIGHIVVTVVVEAHPRGFGVDDTLAGAVDIAVGDAVGVVVDSACGDGVGAYDAAEDGDIAVARVLGQQAVGRRYSPSGLAIAFVVALAHRGHVAAAVDILGHAAAEDVHFGVAEDLTGDDVVDLGIVEGVGGGILEFVGVLVDTLAAAEDRAEHKTALEGDDGRVVDVAVLTRAVDGADDLVGGRGQVDVDVGGTCCGYAARHIAVAHGTAGRAIDVAPGGVGTGDVAYGAAGDVHLGVARGTTIGIFVGPAEGVGGSEIGVFGDAGNGAHRAQLASTIDIVVDGAAGDVDLDVAAHEAGEGRYAVARGIVVHLSLLSSGQFGMTHTAAKDVAVGGGTRGVAADNGIGRDVDDDILGHSAQLGAAVDIALDLDVVADVDRGCLSTT